MGIKENIIQKLLGQEMSVNRLLESLRHNRNQSFQVIRQMLKDGELLQRNEGKQKKILSLPNAKPTISLKHIMSSLPLAEQRADKILNILNKSRPLFIPRKIITDGEKVKPKIIPKNKNNLDKIIIIINDLVSRSVALTYAQCLDLFPEKNEESIKQYHKDCIQTIRKIMSKLENQHKESELDLGSYMYYSVNGYNHLTTLLFLAKRE